MVQAQLIIGTSTAVPAAWGTSVWGDPYNGFTSGNMTGGIQPTSLSADWFNAVQMEIANTIAPYSSGPLGLYGSPTDLTQALDHAFINQRPLYTGNPTFTFSTQTVAQAALYGGSMGPYDLVQRVTRPRSNIAAGASSDVASISLPTDSQCLLKLSLSVVQTDALATNYCQAVKYVSARNVAGTATVQDTQTPYFFTAGITYTVSIATSLSSIILRVSCPAVPAAKKHNAFGTIEMINCHNTL